MVGDLMLDVVLAPSRALELGTDVPGRVLIERVASDRVQVRAIRVAGARTGRIGVVVAPDGERSFVADRGAADRLTPDDLKASWFDRCAVLHLPAYSLLTKPLGDASVAAAGLARGAGARVSVDLASVGPLLARGRRSAQSVLRAVAPDVVFATASEAIALVGPRVESLVDLAPIAVVKRGSRGATVLARDGDAVLRFEVATKPLPATDSTGAGDAFDAGFLAGWLEAEQRGAALPAALQRAALAGHRAAARQLATPAAEVTLG